LLHGEHYLKVNKLPIPISGELKTESFPMDVINKGGKGKKNVLMRSGYQTYAANGDLLFTNVGSYFIRDCESSTGQNQTFEKNKQGISNFYTKEFEVSASQVNDPDFTFEFKTESDLAALYRLNGDFNPLHIDPMFAKGGNFSRPILHGLCFYGISAKALVDHYGAIDEIKARFTSFVYPGETLKIVAWRNGDIVKFQTWVVERNVKVIDFAAVKLVNSNVSAKL
jgi:multifunctional beta-oxidation protein